MSEQKRSLSLLLSCLILLSLTGCFTVGPDCCCPEGRVACSWNDWEGCCSTDPADHSAWWTYFDDEILEALIKQAYCQNLSLQTAGIRILESRARLGIATGERYPQFQQLNGSYARSRLSEYAPPISDLTPAAATAADLTQGLHTLSFDVSWELDFWGRFRRGIESAEADYCASIANYDDVLVTLLAEVARTYAAVRTFQENIRIAEYNIEIQRRSLEITEVRFRHEFTTELDVQQARTILLNTQASILRFQNSLTVAKDALCVLLGLTPGELDGLLNTEGEIPKAPAKIAVGAPADLLRRRPDIRLAEFQALSQCALVGVAQADLYPHFSLFGSLGYSSVQMKDLFRGDSSLYSYGPSISWDIWNYGRLKNRVRVEDARLQEALTRYEEVVLQAQAEVEDALSGIILSERGIVILEESVEAAERSVELAQIQYREGLTDFTRVLNTQQALLLQQEQLVTAKSAVADSLFSLFKALGGGWQARLCDGIIPCDVAEEMVCRTDWGCLLEVDEEAPYEDEFGWRGIDE